MVCFLPESCLSKTACALYEDQARSQGGFGGCGRTPLFLGPKNKMDGVHVWQLRVVRSRLHSRRPRTESWKVLQCRSRSNDRHSFECPFICGFLRWLESLAPKIHQCTFCFIVEDLAESIKANRNNFIDNTQRCKRTQTIDAHPILKIQINYLKKKKKRKKNFYKHWVDKAQSSDRLAKDAVGSSPDFKSRVFHDIWLLGRWLV